jgi:Transcription factor TFIID (or TATA-binding protein, TBP)
MKQKPTSDEETRDLLDTTDLEDDIELHTATGTINPTIPNGNMMTNDSLDSTGTKMLMPHEMGGASASAASLVGQHSIHHNFGDQLHHGTSFYHAPNSYNGFHSSFHSSYSTLNSNSTMITNNHTFSNLIHQQMNNNHHTGTTTASSVPPLIHQQTFYTDKSDMPQADTLVKSESTVEAAKEAVDDEETDVPVEAQVPVEENEEPEPEIDIVISNVVCAFSVRSHLTLKDIALNGANVEYKRENGMVTMKLRKPYTTASVWSSGKITCTGATSEDEVRNCRRAENWERL